MGKVIYLDLYRKEKESNNEQIKFDFPLKGKPMSKDDMYSLLDNYKHDDYLGILSMIINQFKDE